MTIRNLDNALHPRSVAVIGASDRPGSVGAVVMRNIIDGGFEGPVWPVHPEDTEIAGLKCYGTAGDLPGVPDVAVVLTPPEAVPGVISELGEKGCKVAVVITAGLNDSNGLRQKMLDAARPHLLRVIGPNTVGLILPEAKLNASFAHIGAEPGKIALLSQSGAIVTTLLDWAAEHEVGFSQVVSLGDMADVDVSDYLDLLAMDGRTRAVLMYLESMPRARKFVSAARAVSRLKPVIAIKAGRSVQAARAAATHTGALSGTDLVVDAALRRAGVLRVRGLSEMFSAAETVARFKPLERARLGIVTNGGGAGVLAVDRLMEGSGELAELSAETLGKLDPHLPANWSRGNPVDIIGDAPAERYLSAIDAVAEDPGVDVLMVINCPTGVASSDEVAAAVAGRTRRGMVGRKPVLSCWLGGGTARKALGVLREAGVACYDTPASAAGAAKHLTDWGRAQAALLRVPDRAVQKELLVTPRDAREKTHAILSDVAREGRRMLTEPEAKAVLRTYGLEVPELDVAGTQQDVAQIAEHMLKRHERLVVKLLSRQITHKSDVGGVVLDIASPRQAEAAAHGIAERIEALGLRAQFDGFTVQPMIRRAEGHELILGMSHDPVFGPTILFGAGGVAVEVLHDTAIALPPLDAGLAADLISRTRVSELLAGYRGHRPVNAVALQGALIALSHLVEDFPCLQAVDINPLLTDAEGVVALDARIQIEPGEVDRPGPNPDLAIRPYPADWRRELVRGDETFILRPVRPADALLYPDFFEHVDPEDIRLRFMAPRHHFPQEMALKLTQLDYDREMAFVAIRAEDGALAGVSRMACEPDRVAAEYALLVRSDLHGRGLGTALMQILIDYAMSEGLERLDGIILKENRGMLRLVQRLGFVNRPDREERSVMASTLDLRG